MKKVKEIMSKGKDCDFEDLKGKTITDIYTDNENYLAFDCTDGTSYLMYHLQDCCENVTINDIVGQLEWLLNTPILLAEQRTNQDNPRYDEEESFTWTFYELATINGNVTIRWYGSSNGYYSESVDFIKYTPEENE